MNPMEFFADRVIVMAAPNGARRTQQEHPAVPITAAEIAACAAGLADLGVSVLHLHVRDADGRHTIDVDRYRQAIDAVRREVGDRMIIQVTSEAVGRYQQHEQVAMVRQLKPEAVSLALRELCPDEAAEPAAGAFFAALRDQGTWPQYIVYSAEELVRFDRLRRQGFFGEDHPFCLLVLGRYSDSLEGSTDELDAMLASVDASDFPWAVCCFGAQEFSAAKAAADARGHVRLGFENNLVLADGRTASDNEALVGQFTDWLAASGRQPAGADLIREAWGLG